MILKGFKFGMLLQIAIGPVCLFIFQTAASFGIIAAETGVIGVTLIDTLYIIAAIFGLDTLLKKSHKTQKFLKYFGALVLILFGLSTMLGAFDISILPNLGFLFKTNSKGILMKAMILTLSNPLTIVFWAGVFSTKILEENMNQSQLYSFGFGAILSTLFFLSFIAILGSFINNFLSDFTINILNVIVGLVLIGFAVKSFIKQK